MVKRVFLLIIFVVCIALMPIQGRARPVPKLIRPSKVERTILEWINQARQDPGAAVAALGMDKAELLEKCPELAPVFSKGLPMLRFDGNLYMAARIASDAIAAGGVEGSAAKQVMRYLEAVNFIGGRRSDVRAAVAFVNLVNTREAARRLFRQVFTQELSPGAKRHILAPDYSRVGISLRCTRRLIEGRTYNAYVLVIEFACNFLSLPEMQLVQMVNQARSKPVQVAASLGIDLKSFEQKLWLKELSRSRLDPVVPNRALCEAASVHALDMLERSYFCSTSPEGLSPIDRALEAGYGGHRVAEWLGGLGCVAAMDGQEAAKVLFACRARAELGGRVERPVIFGSGFTDFGVALSHKELTDQDEPAGLFDRLFVVVGEFGSGGCDDGLARIMGVVYKDLDGNGLYGPGEGLSGVQLALRGVNGGKLDAFTDEAGGFCLSVEPGKYDLYWIHGQERQKLRLEVDDGGVWLGLAVPDDEAEAAEEGSFGAPMG